MYIYGFDFEISSFQDHYSHMLFKNTPLEIMNNLNRNDYKMMSSFCHTSNREMDTQMVEMRQHPFHIDHSHE